MPWAQVLEIRQKAAEIATQARAKFDEITDDTPEARAAEIETEFDAMMAEHDKLQERATRMERLARAEDQAGQPDPRRPQGDNRSTDPDDGAGDEAGTPSLDYREIWQLYTAFGPGVLTREQQGVLMEHRHGATPQAMANMSPEIRAQAAGADAAGGYTVPEGFSGEIDRNMAIWGPMWDADVCRELVTATGNALPWPTIDDTTQTGEQHTENAAATDDASGDVVVGQKMMNAYMYNTKVVRVPLELIQDSAFDWESMLVDDLFAERLGRLANTVLTTGDGTNKPNGIATASGLGFTFASNAAITSDELLDMQHSVDPAFRASPKCRWQFNDTTLKAVRKLKDGQGNYLWQMGDIRNGEPAMLLDKPYSINQAVAGIGASARSILFGDHSRYVVRKVKMFQTMVLRERYAENFQIGIIGFKRFDGELLNANAVKHGVHPA